MTVFYKLSRPIHIFIFCFLFSFSGIKAQWVNISSNPQQYFRNMSFPSEQVGYAIMDDSGTAATKFYKTVNAGNSWQHLPFQDTVFSTADIIDMHFPSDDVGYIVFRAFDSGLHAKVYKSTDAGQNWTNVTPPNMNLGTGLMDVYFANEDSGLVCSGNELYRTINAGQSWSRDTFHLYGGPTEFDFNQNHFGIMGGWDGTFNYKGFIYYTSDLGLNWDTLKLWSYQSQILEVEVTENNTAYAISGGSFNNGPTLYKSTNNGQSWDTIVLSFIYDSLDQISDMIFVNDLRGYLCTYKGYIHETTDGGMSWSIDHIDKPSLGVLAFNGKEVLCGGPLNTLLTKTIIISTPDYSAENELLVFPNPMVSQGILHFTKDVKGDIDLLNAEGKLIRKWINVKDNQINLTDIDLKDGLYFLRISNEEPIRLMIQ